MSAHKIKEDVPRLVVMRPHTCSWPKSNVAVLRSGSGARTIIRWGRHHDDTWCVGFTDHEEALSDARTRIYRQTTRRHG